MKVTVRVSFGPTEVICQAPAAAPSADEGRRWLDEQFVARDCEPLRALGKVLTGDKLVALAMAIGADGFRADESLRAGYARAACAVLGREAAHVDVDAQKVSY